MNSINQVAPGGRRLGKHHNPELPDLGRGMLEVARYALKQSFEFELLQ